GVHLRNRIYCPTKWVHLSIKWISLMLVIMTDDSTYSIEEPENYLHPLMQSEVISVMRSKMAVEKFVILSTHSETILNSARPEEVIVVSFENDKTVASRPSNVDILSDEIARTGFGLGYYYNAGALDD
ncbi:MAG: AAA family ATPase, partial [Mariprofundaceae bacterium]|nr:AAA family ATPase [Mariprofundaceae bacterium]